MQVERNTDLSEPVGLNIRRAAGFKYQVSLFQPESGFESQWVARNDFVAEEERNAHVLFLGGRRFDSRKGKKKIGYIRGGDGPFRAGGAATERRKTGAPPPIAIRRKLDDAVTPGIFSAPGTGGGA